MPDWKRVKVSFPTTKLGPFIEPVKRTVSETSGNTYRTVYGVTNTDGITVTGKKASKDISNYIAIDHGCFAYNPYRINVGSIGFNSIDKKGCVSPAYVVFKARENLNPEFLFEYLKSDYGNHLINWYGNRGGVRNALRYDDLCEIDIPKVDFAKQSTLLQSIHRMKSMVLAFENGLDEQLELLQKLKQAVLKEAIEGKLTAEWRKQNSKLISGENHATKLLERICSEKEQLIKNGKLRKDKPLFPITDAEKPFALPEGWIWSRLGQLATKITDGTHFTPVYKKDGVQFVSAKDIKNGYLTFEKCKFISQEEHDELYRRCNPELNDLIVSKSGSIGTVVLNKNRHQFSLFESLALVKYLQDAIWPEYFVWGLQFACNNLKREHIRGVAVKHLHLEVMRTLLVALPPLAEQQEIAVRLKRLSQSIIELEQQVSDRQQRSELLMQSVLREAFEHSKPL